MRIIGVGIDIVKNSRIKTILQKSHSDRFLSKMLHKDEIIEYNSLLSQQRKTNFVSSRWAVKEAIVKATGKKQLDFANVNIVKDNNGKPSISLSGDINTKLADELRIKEIMISLSHEDDYSVAYAIVTAE